MRMSAKNGGFDGSFYDSLQVEKSSVASPVAPERNLLAAIMARAICDAFGTAHCEKHLKRSARCWLFAALAPKRPFSFAWVAMNLDLNPEELQSRLRNASEEELAQQISVLRS